MKKSLKAKITITTEEGDTYEGEVTLKLVKSTPKKRKLEYVITSVGPLSTVIATRKGQSPEVITKIKEKREIGKAIRKSLTEQLVGKPTRKLKPRKKPKSVEPKLGPSGKGTPLPDVLLDYGKTSPTACLWRLKSEENFFDKNKIRTTIELVKEIKDLYGKSIALADAYWEFLPLVKAGELDRDTLSGRGRRVSHIWFLPDTDEVKIQKYKRDYRS